MNPTCKRIFAPVLLAAIFLGSERAWALQVHPAPTGLYAHQIAHVFFIVSMAALAYWLQKNRLVARRGWRFVQLSCLLFILWNLGAIVGHVIDHALAESAFVGSGWSRALVKDEAIAPYLYWFLRMDHLVSVPAMAALFLGLRSFRREAGES